MAKPGSLLFRLFLKFSWIIGIPRQTLTVERTGANDRRFVYVATEGYGTISRKDRYYAAEGLEKFLRLRVESVSSYLDYFRVTSA